MNIQELKSQIENFKKLQTKGSITPDSLGTLLSNILDAASALQFTILDVNVYDNKHAFVNNENWEKVWAANADIDPIPVAIRVNYSSGNKVLFCATCVKQNYISLHAKAGSCELHIAADGSFTVSGTSLW